MKDKFRMIHWLLYSVALYAMAIYLTSIGILPQIQIILWKAGHLTVAAFIGYWIDRGLFPESRLRSNSLPMLQIRRALIVGAAMLTVGMGM